MGNIKIGSSDITLKVGSSAVTAAYIGSTLVYSGGTPPTPPSSGSIIEYTASAKLVETTTLGNAGLYTNAFSGTSGQLSITNHSFSNGTGTIEFDGDVKTVGTYAFFQCNNVTTITLPSSVSVLDNQPFWGCTSLTDITIKATTAPTFNLLVFDNTNNCNINVPCSSITSYAVSIKDGLVNSYSFLISQWTARLRGIPQCSNRARWTGNETFCDGYDLYQINQLQLSTDNGSTWSNVQGETYNQLLQEMSEQCGYVPPPAEEKWVATYMDSHTESAECDEYSTSIYDGDIEKYELVELSIGDCVEYIENEALREAEYLENVTIGTGVTNINDEAFYGCYNLQSITINATNPPSLGSDVFSNTNDCPIYVPDDSYYDYIMYWWEYENRIQAIPNS